ncbi:uncharacterized protein BX664DRAFT_334166 [Halteromyces radiatus]|uniref:uncharacterized protein n=1 Tax=Halteromyces radiatus TaxID=101107 RepID=UPI002220FC88|nr:uncharacterized protein BX664DRAFT_334166 [Halteromyces radiatus]KAI8089894.1 hypothetical protein BX664DRAFT_334166 [Halteromyces radiatus]
MPASLNYYLTKFHNLARNSNGKQLARQLSLEDKHTQSLLNQHISLDQVDELCRNRLESPWDEIAACHLKALVYNDEDLHLQAYDAQKDLVQFFQRAMSGLTRWCLPVLYVINNDLRILATKVDNDTLETNEGKRKKLEEAANIISKSFTYCITDRSVTKTSKKFGTYFMIGLLFRIYFKLKQQNLCKNILRALKATDMPSIEDFPKSDRVTFRYYLGRLYFLGEDYAKAENELDLAFRECMKSQRKNKELILQTLLPVRLIRGVLPSRALLEQYPKTNQVYGDIAKAIKCGNVKAFNEALVRSETTLIRQGTYFAVEKAQSIAMRQLFRKVYQVMGNSSRLAIPKFKAALELVGLEVDMEETEWMLANMIYKGYIKGYLSHEKLFLVLSKGDPFPNISSISQ